MVAVFRPILPLLSSQHFGSRRPSTTPRQRQDAVPPEDRTDRCIFRQQVLPHLGSLRNKCIATLRRQDQHTL